MKPDEFRRLMEEVVRDNDPFRAGTVVGFVLLWAVVTLAAGYLGAYLSVRARNLATRADYDNLLAQTIRTAQATESVKHALARSSSFADRILFDRYNAVNDLNHRIELARIDFERWRRDRNTVKDKIVSGETLLLTELHADLHLKRAVLTPAFFDLLKNRYDVVVTIWEHETDTMAWNQKLALLASLNDRLQDLMREHFAIGRADLPEVQGSA